MVEQKFMTQRHMDVLSPARSIDDVIEIINKPASCPISLREAKVNQ